MFPFISSHRSVEGVQDSVSVPGMYSRLSVLGVGIQFSCSLFITHDSCRQGASQTALCSTLVRKGRGMLQHYSDGNSKYQHLDFICTGKLDVDLTVERQDIET